jgi:hypothetical protein
MTASTSLPTVAIDHDGGFRRLEADLERLLCQVRQTGLGQVVLLVTTAPVRPGGSAATSALPALRTTGAACYAAERAGAGGMRLFLAAVVADTVAAAGVHEQLRHATATGARWDDRVDLHAVNPWKPAKETIDRVRSETNPDPDPPAQEGSTASVTVYLDAAAPGRLRDYTRSTVGAHCGRRLGNDAALVVSEMVTHVGRCGHHRSVHLDVRVTHEVVRVDVSTVRAGHWRTDSAWPLSRAAAVLLDGLAGEYGAIDTRARSGLWCELDRGSAQS